MHGDVLIPRRDHAVRGLRDGQHAAGHEAVVGRGRLGAREPRAQVRQEVGEGRGGAEAVGGQGAQGRVGLGGAGREGLVRGQGWRGGGGGGRRGRGLHDGLDLLQRVANGEGGWGCHDLGLGWGGETLTSRLETR